MEERKVDMKSVIAIIERGFAAMNYPGATALDNNPDYKEWANSFESALVKDIRELFARKF